MCNIWQMDHSNEASFDEFISFLSDEIFEKVEVVGINGGEPSLLPNLYLYAKAILKLPKIKSLNVISHGFNKKPFFKAIEEIYKMCIKKNVNFHISISLDGVGEIHNTVRGMPNVYGKTISTINEIKKNQQNYCDSFDIGCTIVKQNIHHLIELDTFARSHNYNIKYRLGIANKRINSDKTISQYSVINSTLRQNAKEFFHFKISDSESLSDKFKYFSIFYWLNNNNNKRLLGCMWKDEGITIDSRGDLYYCAVASDSIGNLRNEKGEELFFDDDNIEYRKRIIRNICDSCIHDYMGRPELPNLLTFFKEIYQHRLSMKIYEIKTRFFL
jgi:MoaA/NifB/PqqE/SkfB family radical SAM enzyme